MRYVFWFWLFPMSVLWGWIGLSYHDISFGTFFLSRANHDLVFHIYSMVLGGMEHGEILRLLAKACIVDSFLIFGILAFRRRREIRAWWQARKGDAATGEPAEAAQPAVPAE